MPNPRPLITALLATLTAGCGDHAPTLADPALASAARSVARGDGHLPPATLAERLAHAGTGLGVIDIRPPARFATGHIDGSENRPLEALLAPAAGQPRPGRPLVLVSEDGAQAAEAALLLRMAGFDAYVLEGGYAGWVRYRQPAPVVEQDAGPAVAVDRAAPAALPASAPPEPVARPAPRPADPIGLGPPPTVAPAHADPLGLGGPAAPWSRN